MRGLRFDVSGVPKASPLEGRVGLPLRIRSLRRKLLPNTNLGSDVNHGWKCLRVVIGLHDLPRPSLITKVLGETSRSVGRDSATFFVNLVNASCRNVKFNRKSERSR